MRAGGSGTVGMSDFALHPQLELDCHRIGRLPRELVTALRDTPVRLLELTP